MFRSEFANDDKASLAMSDVRAYRKAQDEVLNDDGSVRYKAQPEVKGSTLGLMATYRDGSQLFIAQDQLAAVLYTGPCFVSNYIPVLTESLPTLSDLPTAEDLGPMVQRAGFDSVEDYVEAAGRVGHEGAPLFYNIGVNWPASTSGSSEVRWVKEGEDFLYTKRFMEKAQELVDSRKGKKAGLTIEQAVEQLEAEGWSKTTVNVPAIDVRRYTSAFLRYNASLIVSVVTGRRAQNGNATTVAVAAIPLYRVSEVIFGQRAIAPKPESRRAQRGQATSTMAAAAAVARKR
jgi:hypothetical protein